MIARLITLTVWQFGANSICSDTFHGTSFVSHGKQNAVFVCAWIIGDSEIAIKNLHVPVSIMCFMGRGKDF